MTELSQGQGQRRQLQLENYTNAGRLKVAQPKSLRQVQQEMMSRLDLALLRLVILPLSTSTADCQDHLVQRMWWEVTLQSRGNSYGHCHPARNAERPHAQEAAASFFRVSLDGVFLACGLLRTRGGRTMVLAADTIQISLSFLPQQLQGVDE